MRQKNLEKLPNLHTASCQLNRTYRMDELKKQSTKVLFQLLCLVEKLNTQEYRAALPILSGNSVGKHVRHILEFYEILLESAAKEKTLNYDARKRNTDLETKKTCALEKITTLHQKITQKTENNTLQVAGSYATDKNEVPCFSVKSSYARELLYNIEHAIHHIAIIKIAIGHSFPHIALGEQVGVAASTLRFQKQF